MDVVGIGRSCLDQLINISELPETDESKRILAYSRQGGGKVPTAAVALSRLGADVAMIDVLSDDSYGNFLLEDYINHNIDVSQVIIDKGKETAFSIVLSEKTTGGRNILYHTGSCRPLEVNDLNREYIKSASYLHLAYVSDATKKAALWAKESGVSVVFDADNYREDIEEMIPLIDVFIASEHYYNAKYNTNNYLQNCRELMDKGPSIVVFTLGSKGSIGLQGDCFFQEPGFDVKVKDTTGAGDVYHGAFIYGLLQGWNIRKIARFSNAVAAIKCTRMGGRAAIPNLETVFEFLDTGEIDYREINKRVELYKKGRG